MNYYCAANKPAKVKRENTEIGQLNSKNEEESMTQQSDCTDPAAISSFVCLFVFFIQMA